MTDHGILRDGCDAAAPHARASRFGETMSLHDYLQKHFVDKPTFASLTGISPERLDRLLADEAIPHATYICDGNSVRSAAFGVTDIREPLTGEYFRPECVRWAKIAAQAAPGSERATVLAELTGELHRALQNHIEDSAAIDAEIQRYLPHFWNGTFGLCVADPSSGVGIVNKEMLQEKLTALTANGSDACPADISPKDLLQLIDDYADSAMPFSPAEYERSSRKRLVDDLRPTVAKA